MHHIDSVSSVCIFLLPKIFSTFVQHLFQHVFKIFQYFSLFSYVSISYFMASQAQSYSHCCFMYSFLGHTFESRVS